MQLFPGLFDSKKGFLAKSVPWEKPVVALGNFDGVHLGHQEILKATVAQAKRIGGTSLCLTFMPHPMKFLTQGQGPVLIHTHEQKLAHLKKWGIDVVVEQAFDAAFSKIEAQTFMEKYLRDGLSAHDLRIGSRFHFGHQRKGNETLLRTFCTQHGIGFSAVGEQQVDGAAVSSSEVRRSLIQGHVERAHKLLGHPYQLTGQVIRGEGRGERLGFATANLIPENETLLPFGVYLCEIVSAPGREARPAICNFGVRPTFSDLGDGRPIMEAHLFDFKGDLYGDRLQIDLLKWVRAEMRFADAQELQNQVKKDLIDARAFFKKANKIR